MEEAIFLLGYWRPHEQFQRWLEQRLLSFLPEHEKQIRFYADILEKVYVLNLDRMLTLALNRYSYTGRPAKNQPEIFRALVVMSHFKEGVTPFVEKLRAYPVLAAVCGFEPDSVPGVGTFTTFWTGFGWEKNRLRSCVNHGGKRVKNQRAVKNCRKKRIVLIN
jgi:hypothetical protein